MNLNLINLLVKLEDRELKTVVRFAKSPFHNSNKLIIKMLKELLVFHPKFDSKKLTKEYIFHKIHPQGTVYHDGRMNVQMTHLAKLIERFYMYQEFETDEFLQKKMQGKGFQKRGFYDKYKKNFIKTLDSFEEYQIKNQKYFYQKYYMLQDFHFNIKTDNQKIIGQKIDEAMHYLDLFYLNEKLKLSNDLIVRSKRFDSGINILFRNEILNYAKDTDFSSYPTLHIYKEINYLKEIGYDSKRFDDIKSIFFKSLNTIALADQKEIFSYLINFIISEYNFNPEKYGTIVLELYQFGMEENLIVHDNTITSTVYSNILISSAKASKSDEDFAWCKEFIFQYEKFLPTKDIFITKSYALAFLYFTQGRKEKKKSHFLQSKDYLKNSFKRNRYTTTYMKSAALLIRVYYELILLGEDCSDSLEKLFVNSERILKTDKVLAEKRKQGYLAFHNLAKKIFSLKMKINLKKRDIESLEKSFLHKKQSILLKDWLDEKKEELINSSSLK